MAITVNWATGVIGVPKADTALVQSLPFEIRELDLNAFRLALKDLEDDEAGMAFPITHNHNPPVSVGGVNLARVVELLEPYTVTFENGMYAVNLVGANTNLSDKLNLNSVQVRSANSAGLIESENNADEVWASNLEVGFSAARLLRIIASAVAGKSSGGPSTPTFRNLADDGDQLSGTADNFGNRTGIVYGD